MTPPDQGHINCHIPRSKHHPVASLCLLAVRTVRLLLPIDEYRGSSPPLDGSTSSHFTPTDFTPPEILHPGMYCPQVQVLPLPACTPSPFCRRHHAMQELQPFERISLGQDMAAAAASKSCMGIMTRIHARAVQRLVKPPSSTIYSRMAGQRVSDSCLVRFQKKWITPTPPCNAWHLTVQAAAAAPCAHVLFRIGGRSPPR